MAPERILLVGVHWLGDALFLTPAIRAVRKAHPSAHVVCLVPNRILPVYARNPHLDAVWTYDERAPIASPSFWGTVGKLRAGRFDAAILFHGSRTKARLAKWAGIAERWGTCLPAGRRPALDQRGLLTRTAPLPPPGTHRAQIHLDMLRAFGIPDDGRRIDFVPDPAAEASVEKLLLENGIDPQKPFAAVHPGGNWGLKRWPAERFRAWLERFLKSRPDAKAVFCGSDSERGLCGQIVRGLDPARTAVLAGRTSLDELAFLFRKSLFVLSNDSGPIHVAASQGVPLVGLFGPTSPAQTGPWTRARAEILWRDPGCEIPCYFRSCDRRVCLESLSPEAVAAACERAAG